MSRLAIIGASYLQLPLVKKAKELGHEVICFAWSEGAVCQDYVDKFYPISIVEKDEILRICRDLRIDGICTIASDVAAPTVAYVAANLGLNGNTYESACKANNKFQMREALRKASVQCPQYICVTDILQLEGLDFKYPLIVKPSDRSGSLGVVKVNSHSQLLEAVNNAIGVSFKGQAMVEEFIEGREISVEFISYHGCHYPLQITDKVTTGAPHFVELAHHQPADLSEERFCEIYSITRNALNALGLMEGASHSEYKITPDGRIYVMEIGGRMGGDFIGSDLVRLSTGYDFVKGVIEVALDSFTEPVKLYNMNSGVYFLCKETEWLLPVFENIKNYPEIVSAEITESVLKQICCSGDRSGYIIYHAPTSDFKFYFESSVHS